METRQRTEVKVWKLLLNNMRGNCEDVNLVAFSTNKEKLIDWYEDLLVDPYKEEGAPSFACHGSSHIWHKYFEKGSCLEWYNPLTFSDGSKGHFGDGIIEEWIDEGILNTTTILRIY